MVLGLSKNKRGMILGAREHKKHSIKNIGFALVIVSDTRTEKNDASGMLMKELITKAGHRVVGYKIVRNDKDEILSEALQLLSSNDVDAIIFCGGTGISSRDITIEAIKPIFDKELNGFGEIFRVLSMEEIGSAAIMSRATAGVTKGKAIFCIPGSKGAVKLALERLILQECGHILWEVKR